jgi:dTDP-4-amino-4,6-dideoxygalactose transaminase
MNVPFFDLGQQYRALSLDVQRAMQRVFDDSAFSGGAEVERFEGEFAAYCNSGHCVGVDSGSSALHLALLACGIGPGDEVITTPMTFIATVAAIEHCGATPILADCAADTLALDPDQVRRKFTSRTKAVIPVHLHGRMMSMEPLLELAKNANVMVIEDAAQAHGAVKDRRKAGTFGRLGCFSFYPSKNLGAYGEGGAVITDDKALAEKLRMLRNWGADERGVHIIKGFNRRLHGLQAAVLRVKLQRLDAWNATRRELAAVYRRRLIGADIILPVEDSPGSHVYHVYAVRSPDRDALRKWLTERGIGTHIHYPVPVHMQPAYARPEYPYGSFPNSERAATQLLSLPMFPEMRLDQAERVCDEMLAFFKR